LKVSIITAVYNSKDSLSDCLRSLSSQTHHNFEHVVVDGLSTDGSLDLLYANQHRPSVFLSEADDGIYFALNKGVSLASGEIIGFLHSDDFYADEKVISRISDAFSNPHVQAVYGDLFYVDRVKQESVVRKWYSGEFLPHNLKKGWMPPHPTLFLRRSLYEKCGFFDTRYRIAADYDFILRVLTQLAPEQVVYIPEVLVKMRTGGVSNRSFKHLLRKSWEDYQIIRRHKVGGLGTLLRKNFSKLPQFFTK